MVSMYVEAEADKRALERIRWLLDHWDAIFDGSPSSEPFGVVGPSAGSKRPGKLPRMAHHSSVKELERCLVLLASANPGDYRHLKTYRCGAEWRCVDTWERIKLPSGRYDWVPIRKRERIVPRWIRPERVLAGERFLCRVFRGEVFIPDDLWEAFVPAA